MDADLLRPLISVVLPAFREEASIEAALDRLEGVLEPLGDWEVVVVDDGSPDGTWELLQDLSLSRPRLRAARLSRNFGKEAAIAAGIERARGRVVVLMDADLQHPPELIPEMLRLWDQDGVDVVNAVKRDRRGEGRLKTALTRGYYGLFSRLAGFDLSQASDFKLLDRRVADAYLALPERQKFFRGLVGWMGFRQASVVFDVAPRHAGRTTWSSVKLMGLAADSIVAFSTLPMHLMTVMGLAFGAVSTVLAGQALWMWAAGEAVPGFTTVILLLILIGAVLMTGLGIIGAYVAKIYEEVKRRPRYLVQQELEAGAVSRPVSDTDRMDRRAPAPPPWLEEGRAARR